MITNKHITVIVSIIMAAAVLGCLGFAAFADIQVVGVTMEYESALFNTEEKASISIDMDDGDWAEMLANTASGDYYSCDVVINGKTISNVGIRSNTDGSLTMAFDKYEKGQTCFGLDKLVLKSSEDTGETTVYDMCLYLDADTPLYNYAGVTVNGEDLGEYLILEGVDDSFMLRNYGIARGELYELESYDGDVLKYTDDDNDSYTVIWESALSKIGKKDRNQVIAAIKSISEGDDTEEYLYVDNVLKYMAVHTYVSSGSYSYYLYEHSGKLNIIPGSYDLSGDGSGSVFVSAEIYESLLENEKYKNQYNEYLERLEAEYGSIA